ncbi:Zn(II)2Cys6 transcription factor domain-containing protein [Aspergillus alliaceus]|uniref:Zn(II)2Cys6 transcription factor domain-containing protein n=1 Tax=Petromyces alliaceus TaxID=209559 RepID=UPI0012A67D7F|nr:uncharacterized protein BDW43DRAFT_298787 [Aspergillus alliaceus]KAB8235760.1 hypothetical protein BDW43DRAFT_298787 [Aspergillus alliaceus]
MKGRRSHQKSRSGCLKCRQRKVKCGKEKPTCSNCRKHSVGYYFAPRKIDHLSSASQNVAPFPLPGAILSTSPATAHYTTSTAYKFSLHPLLQTFWRVEVPQIGFAAPYTLRVILAISALHLAYLRPDKTQLHLSQASTRHEAALRLATPEMANINPDNSAPLIANWLLLIRGTGTILNFVDESLKTGPLASMLSVRAQFRKFEPTTQHQALEGLRQLALSEIQDQHMPFVMCLEHNLRLETADVFIWLMRGCSTHLMSQIHNQIGPVHRVWVR